MFEKARPVLEGFGTVGGRLRMRGIFLKKGVDRSGDSVIVVIVEVEQLSRGANADTDRQRIGAGGLSADN